MDIQPTTETFLLDVDLNCGTETPQMYTLNNTLGLIHLKGEPLQSELEDTVSLCWPVVYFKAM